MSRSVYQDTRSDRYQDIQSVTITWECMFELHSLTLGRHAPTCTLSQREVTQASDLGCHPLTVPRPGVTNNRSYSTFAQVRHAPLPTTTGTTGATATRDTT